MSEKELVSEAEQFDDNVKTKEKAEKSRIVEAIKLQSKNNHEPDLGYEDHCDWHDTA